MQYIAVFYDGAVKGFVTLDEQKLFLQQEHPDVLFATFSWSDTEHPPPPKFCQLVDGQIIVSIPTE